MNSNVAAAAFAVLAISLAIYGFYMGGEGLAGDDGFDEEALEEYVVEAVNEQRTSQGLETLAPRPELTERARAHSNHMMERGEATHDGVDGGSHYHRYGDLCRGYTGENVASTWQGRSLLHEEVDEIVRLDDEREVAEHVVDRWLDSTGHRESLFREGWSSTGVGATVAEDGGVYLTQGFCSTED